MRKTSRDSSKRSWLARLKWVYLRRLNEPQTEQVYKIKIMCRINRIAWQTAASVFRSVSRKSPSPNRRERIKKQITLLYLLRRYILIKFTRVCSLYGRRVYIKIIMLRKWLNMFVDEGSVKVCSGRSILQWSEKKGSYVENVEIC